MTKKQKPFNVVANNYMLRYFRQIDIFKLELGNALRHLNVKQGEAPKIKIKDTFVKQYENVNNVLIHKYGSIGIISFYEDQSLPRFEFHIYKNDQVYEIEATKEDINLGAYDYLTEILKMIDKQDISESTENDKIKDIVYTNLPDETSIPDKNLPRDQYVEALLKRRQTLDKIKNN
jgi:hypothetical protein